MSSEGGAEFSDFLEFLASKVRARQSELGGHQICNQLYMARCPRCESISYSRVAQRIQAPTPVTFVSAFGRSMRHDETISALISSRV